jgi:hypothetical protein
MWALRWTWAHRSSCLKLVGLALLAVYFLGNSFHIEPLWVAAYLAIAIGIGAIFVLAVYPLIDRFFPSQNVDINPIGTQLLSEVRRQPLRATLLLPGEDGVFFVPLLWIGISPVTATVAATAFAAAHYPRFPIKACVVKFVFIFCIALVVLPHGLGSVVAGHLILDVLAFFIGGKVFATTPASGPHDA